MSQRPVPAFAFAFASVLLTPLLLAGCHAKEAPTSQFLSDSELMSRDATIPFNKAYWNKQYDSKSYTEITVALVNTQYVMAENFWEKANAAGVDPQRAKSAVQALADYTRQSMIKGFSEDPNHRFKVVDEVGPKTLILELALTQVVPSKAALNAIGYVTWVPTVVAAAGSTVTESQDTGKGVVAIEGRIRDGGSGQIIGMFQDRQNPPQAILDVKSLTWWAPAKQIIDTWAQELVAVANRPPGAMVKQAPAFQLLVW